MRFAILLVAACGSRSAVDHNDASGGGDAPVPDASSDGDGMTAVDAAQDASADVPGVDAFPGVLDVRIDCHNDCTLVANPSAINVHAGTEFQVNWINVGDTECDVAKIDQFNHVPIILGLEPGMSYHDAVHEWCGAIFTGTFEFEIRICTLPSYIPVNCGA